MSAAAFSGLTMQGIIDRSSPDTESGIAFLAIRSTEIVGQVSRFNIPQIIIESEDAKKIAFSPDEEEEKSPPPPSST